MGKNAFVETVQSPSEDSDAKTVTDPLNQLVGSQYAAANPMAMDNFTPSPLMVVKPNGETILVNNTNPRASKRHFPMMVVSTVKKSRNVILFAYFDVGMSSDINSPTEVDHQPRRGT
ncbi:hypothetical protein V6N11_060427 [Hibiscus sabdariffa]|uniref:Uncharacterized protein n=1 Tax=Hibiscus sabdariffa TaxID=183260 RepID=A0ABR2QQA5_9ROSI